jgi:hypothetical protein
VSVGCSYLSLPAVISPTLSARRSPTDFTRPTAGSDGPGGSGLASGRLDVDAGSGSATGRSGRTARHPSGRTVGHDPCSS